MQQTRSLIRAMINDARNKVNSDVESIEKGDCKIIMLTVLWTQYTPQHPQPPQSIEPPIVVRGHYFCNNIPVKPFDYNPTPISAALALPNPKDVSDQLQGRSTFLPEAKLSNWCQRRKPLESRFKWNNPSIGEVLLIRPSKDLKAEYELLEGLTSNLFVIYKDGTIRTSPNGVLEGYARALVLDAAADLGLNVVWKAPTLLDGESGLWDQVFLTSSIRLLIPVDCVYAPTYVDGTSNSFEVVWDGRQGMEQEENGEATGNVPLWKQLYHHILEQQNRGE